MRKRRIVKILRNGYYTRQLTEQENRLAADDRIFESLRGRFGQEVCDPGD
jgi:hypothetical protein